MSTKAESECGETFPAVIAPSGPELNSIQGRHRGCVGSQLEFNRNFTRIAAKWRLISCFLLKGLRSSTSQRQVCFSAAIRAELIMKAGHVGANSCKCIKIRVTFGMSHDLVHSPGSGCSFDVQFPDREVKTRFPKAVISAITSLISLIEQVSELCHSIALRSISATAEFVVFSSN